MRRVSSRRRRYDPYRDNPLRTVDLVAVLLGVGIMGAGAYALAKPAASLTNPGVKTRLPNLGTLVPGNTVNAAVNAATPTVTAPQFMNGVQYMLLFNAVNAAADVNSVLDTAGWTQTSSGWPSQPIGGKVTVQAFRTGDNIAISLTANAGVDPSQLQLYGASGPNIPSVLPA